MKASVWDVSFCIFLHAPDPVSNQLNFLYGSKVQRRVSLWYLNPSLLACAMGPADSKSYRKIAGSSLLYQSVLQSWGVGVRGEGELLAVCWRPRPFSYGAAGYHCDVWEAVYWRKCKWNIFSIVWNISWLGLSCAYYALHNPCWKIMKWLLIDLKNEYISKAQVSNPLAEASVHTPQVPCYSDYWHTYLFCCQRNWHEQSAFHSVGIQAVIFSSVVNFSHRRSARIKKLISQRLMGATKNLDVDPFPDLVGHFGAL